ncbi:phospholipid carrier-dependent glycosyltransferase [Candidatus Woesearchaeota archaeon]|nr:MAG: phospholipid carrier-dependent glycosyltransferase [Candidatus Woesearchaeota archaeon]
MKTRKTLIAFLAAYAIICILLFSSINTYISNGYQRAGAAVYLSDFLKEDLWNIRSLSNLQGKMLEGHAHYKIFTGLSAWPPLQLMILTATYLIAGPSHSTTLLVSLAISLLTLLALYRFTKKAYNENIALIATIFTALSTYFFYESSAPLLENGLALFTILCLDAFCDYLENGNPKNFYKSATWFALGLLYKIQMIFLTPVLLILLIAKGDWKGFLTKRSNYKMILLSALIAIAILSPLIARESILATQGLSSFSERTIERTKYITRTPAHLKGFVTAYDFEFENELPRYKIELIKHRYELTKLQKLVVTLTALFYNWILIPLIIVALYSIIKAKRISSRELGMVLFIVFSAAFFTLHGLLPRYIIPSSIFLCIFAAKGAMRLPKKAITPAIAITLLVLTAQTGFFINKISKGDHIQSMQHDYESTAETILSQAKGDFTIITTRLYETAFFFISKDKQKRAYLELAPEKKAEFEKMLKTGYAEPIVGKHLPYPKDRPPVKYVIVHENLETGPIKGNSDYNLKDTLDKADWAKLAHTINSRWPNSKTWIYEVDTNLINSK